MKKRVVVTGLGIVSPLGLGVKANEEALFKGQSGVDFIKSFIPDDDFPVKIAGEVKGFDPKNFMTRVFIGYILGFLAFVV